MSAINRPTKKTSSRNSILIVSGVITLASVLLFSYLMWYVTPRGEYRDGQNNSNYRGRMYWRNI